MNLDFGWVIQYSCTIFKFFYYYFYEKYECLYPKSSFNIYFKF